MGQWILEEACRQTKAWQTPELPLVVSVNLSARQFQQATLVEDVEHALRSAELEPAS
jgi:EAL domain-containing protein (putative c-di-GMP-specific phosphodiesterase class I)